MSSSLSLCLCTVYVSMYLHCDLNLTSDWSKGDILPEFFDIQDLNLRIRKPVSEHLGSCIRTSSACIRTCRDLHSIRTSGTCITASLDLESGNPDLNHFTVTSPQRKDDGIKSTQLALSWVCIISLVIFLARAPRSMSRFVTMCVCVYVCLCVCLCVCMCVCVCM